MTWRCPACGGPLTRTAVVCYTPARDVWHRANLVTIQATTQPVTVDACDRCEFITTLDTERAR